MKSPKPKHAQWLYNTECLLGKWIRAWLAGTLSRSTPHCDVLLLIPLVIKNFLMRSTKCHRILQRRNYNGNQVTCSLCIDSNVLGKIQSVPNYPFPDKIQVMCCTWNCLSRLLGNFNYFRRKWKNHYLDHLEMSMVHFKDLFTYLCCLPGFPTKNQNASFRSRNREPERLLPYELAQPLILLET